MEKRYYWIFSPHFGISCFRFTINHTLYHGPVFPILRQCFVIDIQNRYIGPTIYIWIRPIYWQCSRSLDTKQMSITYLNTLRLSSLIWFIQICSFIVCILLDLHFRLSFPRGVCRGKWAFVAGLVLTVVQKPLQLVQQHKRPRSWFRSSCFGPGDRVPVSRQRSENLRMSYHFPINNSQFCGDPRGDCDLVAFLVDTIILQFYKNIVVVWLQWWQWWQWQWL